MANNVMEEKQKKAGLFYYGAYYGYRYLKISFFDTMHVSNESRRRFMEKQMLFYNDMGYNLSMKYIEMDNQFDPYVLSTVLMEPMKRCCT
ncbi:hypothetical protein PVIIG_03835 [Plasmodium vivax India VII]|uniref:Uncharacterized protein n=1 Tax=Plasmodium vivax India VII TaxID=1077284 RepID=A0A0J9SJ12_PLAVI|nr:hypothetical protein PVIIG_03835 [Plasmodium vivax India VII]